jgi:YjbE family integral membrane protein
VIDFLSGLGVNMQPQFWISVVGIIWINVLLSGDNAIVIALACRGLPPKQRLIGMVFGTVAALAMRIAFTSVVVTLMFVPYLKIAGGAALLWIALRLLAPVDESDDAHPPADSVMRAVTVIAVADIVMSLDNVLGMAGAAKGHYGMLFVGLAITMPLILFGSALLMRLMERFPLLITLGAGLLGYVAGDMAVGDHAVAGWVEAHAPYLDMIVPVAGALLVVLVGRFLAGKQARARAERVRVPVRQPDIRPGHAS